MCHNPAILFEIDKRGYVKEGFYADLVLVDLDKSWTVTKENTLYKCGWSPFEGSKLEATITHTFVNGSLAYEEGKFAAALPGKRIEFNRSL